MLYVAQGLISSQRDMYSLQYVDTQCQAWYISLVIYWSDWSAILHTEWMDRHKHCKNECSVHSAWNNIISSGAYVGLALLVSCFWRHLTTQRTGMHAVDCRDSRISFNSMLTCYSSCFVVWLLAAAGVIHPGITVSLSSPSSPHFCPPVLLPVIKVLWQENGFGSVKLPSLVPIHIRGYIETIYHITCHDVFLGHFYGCLKVVSSI